jgi:pyruvate dehydrogenase E2 component (dihydrolipoamide acetyltransferase)
MGEFRMPQLGADMEAGTLTEWLCKPGDAVARGDIVAVVETAKGAIEVEIFEDGVVDRLLIDPGTKVPVGTPLALVRGAGEEAVPPPQPAAPPSGAAPPPPEPRPQAPARAAPPSPAMAGPRISPAAARRALALGVDIRVLRGTGTGGAIRLADVEAAAGPARATTPPAAAEAPSPAEAMRRAIGAAMARSKREIPHYYLDTTVDFQPALDWLAARNETRPVTERMLYGALLIKATALALRDFPELNGTWADDAFRPGTGIHIGAAVSLRGGGLVAPAIHDADALGLDELMAALRDLVQRARAMRLRSSQMTDATITVTSLGEQGVEGVYGVIYPPQVALVGFGTPVTRPWAVGGDVVPRRVIRATLSADHRASDGHRGALFLAAIGTLLQKPEAL